MRVIGLLDLRKRTYLHSHTLTATSMVFSCPTRLISDVHVFRVMTAAMKTKPLLFVAFEAVI